MGFAKYLAKRAVTMFGVLMATLLVTVALVGANMDAILKQSVAIDVRTAIINNKPLVESFKNHPEELEKYIQNQIKQEIISLGIDQPCTLLHDLDLPCTRS